MWSWPMFVERRCQVCVEHPSPPRVFAPGGLVDGLDRVMAATAGPKPVGPRLEPRLPLGLQRVRDHRLMGSVEDHGNSERSALGVAALLRDVHPSDGEGLERFGPALHPVGQSCFGLRGERHLAVHARRQTTGVALGHPPHAQQRVGARAEHQLLQVADPLEVPRLRCREDPLPKPPYVVLARRQSTWCQSKGRVLWSVHHDDPSWRPTCPRVLGLRSSSSSQAHLTASARFRVRATRPGIRPVIRDDQLEEPAIVSRFPVAFRPPAAEVGQRRGGGSAPFPLAPSRTRREPFSSPGSPATIP